MSNTVAQLGLLKHIVCPNEANGKECTHVNCMFKHQADAESLSQPHQADAESLSQPHQTCDGAVDATPAQSASDYEKYRHSPPSKRLKTGVNTAKASVAGKGNSDRQTQTGGQIGTGRDASLEAGDKMRTPDLYDPWSPPTAATGKLHDKSVSPPSLKRKEPTRVKPPGELQGSTPVKKLSTAFPRDITSSRQISTSGAGTPKPPTPLQTLGRGIGPVTTKAASSLATSSTLRTPVQKPQPARKPETLNPRLVNTSPVGHEIRYKLLKLLHAEFSRLNTAVKLSKRTDYDELVISDQDLIFMALDHEEKVANQKGPIYTNVMKQDIMKQKKKTVDIWVEEIKMVMEAATTVGKPPEKRPVNGPPVVIETELTPEQELLVLKETQARIITPIKDLAQFGYVPEPPSDADIAKTKEAVQMADGWEVCDRCSTRFKVFPGRNYDDEELLGQLASGGKCLHHPGKSFFPDRVKGDTQHIPKQYRCCGQDLGETPGCAETENHVFKTNDPKRMASVWNYVKTPPNENPGAGKDRAVCFDCEMCYTVYGMELVRVTATSWPDGAELLDVLVQPHGDILDLNSRYSGVWPEDLANAVDWTPEWTPPPREPGQKKVLQKVTSPEVARNLLFSLITPETPLIGHGLENDLNAMRIVHPVLVDSILLYPHHKGLPIRRGLKVLMLQMLNKHIQADTGEGHDSAEDARAAGELVRLKVQQAWTRMQTQDWKFVDGQLRAPEWKPIGKGCGLLTEEFLEEGIVAEAGA